MKRSPPSLQFLAVAVSTDTMSSRPSYRGGRNQWRRGYSDRSGGDQFVTGDSHFRSVRDANRSLGPEVERPNFENHSQFRPRPRPRPRPPSLNPRAPPFHSRPSFDRNPPPYNPNQQFRPPPFYQNQQFRPPQQFRPRPPKPLDYRNWEFARPGPPPDSERFTVLCYNILADYLAINHRSKLYFHIPHHILDWEFRKKSIVFELGLWSADILCFQEVDRFQDLEVELKVRGYNGIWKMRTGDPVDGCAIFWRVSRFKLLHEESIEFSKLGLRDNVAQICVFESMNQSQNHNRSTSGPPASAAGSNKVVICNIHVLYNPKRGEIKLGQVRVLLDRAYAVSKLWDDAPVVLCGDFNCTPESPLYTFIAEQKLNLSELPRDKLSGQASAEIRPPRPFYPNFRGQPTDNSSRAPTMVEEREVMQSSTLLDMQKQNGLDSNLENIPSTSRFSEPICSNTVLNVSDSVSSDEPKKEACQDEDVCKDETELPQCAPLGDLNEPTIGSQSEVGSSVDQMKDEINEYSPPNSHQKDIYPIETGFRGDTSNTSHVLSSEPSQENLLAENKKEACQGEDVCKDETELTQCSPVSDLHEPTISSQSEVGSSVDQMKDEINEYSPPNSHQKDIYPIEMGLRGDTSNTSHVSSSEPSQENLLAENKSVKCENSMGYNYSTEIPSSNFLEVSYQGISENRSSLSNENDCTSTLYGADISNKSVGIDIVFDKKMEDLSLDEQVEVTEEDGTLGEDCSTFLSELHNANSSFPSDFSQFPRSDFVGCNDNEASNECVSSPQQLHSPEPFYVERTTYDPSAWTPMEIEIATGSSECTLMEHPLKLRSTYSEVEDPSGTRDSNGEPLVTSYNRCFLGTVDYIWCSQGLQTVRVLAPIPRHAMLWTPGFPTKKWGSDHIALVSELAFTKDATLENAVE